MSQYTIMIVDGIVSHAAFEAQCADIFTTAQYYDFNADNSIIIGSAGFALHALNVNIGKPWATKDFDLDVIGFEGLITPRIGQGRADDLQYEFPNPPATPLALDKSSGVQGRMLAHDHGYFTCRTMLDQRVAKDGLATLPLPRLIKGKLARGDIKDYAGFLKGQVAAHKAELAIVTDPFWQETVSRAIEVCFWRSENGRREDQTGRFPDWLDELVTLQFNHPAFASIR